MVTVTNMKWWALAEVANDNEGGDDKRPEVQQYFWWPSNLYPGA